MVITIIIIIIMDDRFVSALVGLYDEHGWLDTIRM